jgi:hypothetical protein
LVPELVTRVLEILADTGAVVILSTSWRSFAQLRPLIMAALPDGRVVGQTAHGFTNHTRPREIADFLELPEVKGRVQSWAVVDDMDLLEQAANTVSLSHDFYCKLQENFVRTNKSVGLDEAGKRRLAEILQGHVDSKVKERRR